jgi:nucleoside-diphosphate-sugar epimerase
VTGADGFVGRRLSQLLASVGHEVVAVSRHHIMAGGKHMPLTTLQSNIGDSEVVIHLAARAHVMRETYTKPIDEFRKTNVDLTLSLARIAARAGVNRFVFVSSIGVLGNSSGERILAECDVPSPQEPYAVSKWEAEQALRQLSAESDLPVVIVRPPLVYGPDAKGNFLRLLKLVASRMPLPFGCINNHRSYVGLGNLCDFLLACAFHPDAGDKTFHVSDDEDISTPDLVRMMANEMGRSRQIMRCPSWLLGTAAAAVGRRKDLERLTANLRVDSKLASNTLGWRPKNSLPAGVAEMVLWFKSTHNL